MVRGRSFSRRTFRDRSYRCPWPITPCPRSSGAGGVVRLHPGGRPTRDVSGTRKPTNVIGVSTKSVGGRAVRPDTPSKDARCPYPVRTYRTKGVLPTPESAQYPVLAIAQTPQHLPRVLSTSRPVHLLPPGSA